MDVSAPMVGQARERAQGLRVANIIFCDPVDFANDRPFLRNLSGPLAVNHERAAHPPINGLFAKEGH